jgi:hypothetical protein
MADLYAAAHCSWLPRLSDLYMLLGNEAYADTSEPTIAFGTDSGQYGNEASTIHCVQNQTATLLKEELALLGGRDDLCDRIARHAQQVFNQINPEPVES